MPSFDPAKDVPDLTGKVILVTGGNSGIGYCAIQHLARRGAKVYMGARNEGKAREAIEKLTAEGLGAGEVLYTHVDLSDVTQAGLDAQAFMATESRLDVLVHNATLGLDPPARTYHDIQDSMMVNHFSPVVLTRTLLPLLEKTAKTHGQDVRIVNVTSHLCESAPVGIRYATREQINEEYKGKMVSEIKRYGQSKLAFLLWTKELQRQLRAQGSSILVLSVNPGPTRTPGCVAYLRTWFFPLNWVLILGTFTFSKPEKSSHVPVFAAAAPVVREHAKDYGGAFVGPTMEIAKPPHADADNEELARELWGTTESILIDIGAWKN